MIQLRHLIRTMVLPVKNQCLNAQEQRELRRFLEYPEVLHGCLAREANARLSVLRQLAAKEYITFVNHEGGVDYFRLLTD
ncbi:MAG: hypothetical protein WBA12_12770 [Catalinimonas sp.]